MRQAIYDVMRFWLQRGVDGFRVDVLWHLIKDSEFRDNPPNSNFLQGRPPHEALLPLYSTDRPEMLDVVTEMRRVVDEFRDRVLIGEIYLRSIDWSLTTARTCPVHIYRSISRCCPRSGTRAQLQS